MALNNDPRNNWMHCDGRGGLGRVQSTRRAFLGGLTALSLAGLSPAWAQAVLDKEKRNENVLVVVFLRGGADSLHLVPPYGEDAYLRARPNLGITKKQAVDLDGFFGLHPTLAPLGRIYHDGNMAVVHAVGSGDRSHSHFEAMSTMEQGHVQGGEAAGGGWLARHIAASADDVRPLRAVSWGGILAESLNGSSTAATLGGLDDLKLGVPSPEWLSALTNLYGAQNDQISQSGREMLKVSKLIDKLDPTQAKPENEAVYPQTTTGDALRETAFLIRHDVGLQIACLDSGGWDSHVAQLYLDTQMSDLALGLAAFQQDLGKEMGRVTVVVMSEFGRRLGENSGLGTDHGTGGAMMILGGGVRGGKVYGAWPGLEPHQLAEPADLKATTDYRMVLAELLERRLGGKTTSQVFPGLSGARLNFLSTG